MSFHFFFLFRLVIFPPSPSCHFLTQPSFVHLTNSVSTTVSYCFLSYITDYPILCLYVYSSVLRFDSSDLRFDGVFYCWCAKREMCKLKNFSLSWKEFLLMFISISGFRFNSFRIDIGFPVSGSVTVFSVIHVSIHGSC